MWTNECSLIRPGPGSWSFLCSHWWGMGQGQQGKLHVSRGHWEPSSRWGLGQGEASSILPWVSPGVSVLEGGLVHEGQVTLSPS